MLSHQFALRTAQQSCAQPQSRTFPPPVSCPLILQLSVCLHIVAGCVSFLRKYNHHLLKRTNCVFVPASALGICLMMDQSFALFRLFFVSFPPSVALFAFKKRQSCVTGGGRWVWGWVPGVDGGKRVVGGFVMMYQQAAAFYLWLVRMTHEIQFNRWKMRMPPTSSRRPAQQGVPPART